MWLRKIIRALQSGPDGCRQVPPHLISNGLLWSIEYLNPYWPPRLNPPAIWFYLFFLSSLEEGAGAPHGSSFKREVIKVVAAEDLLCCWKRSCLYVCTLIVHKLSLIPHNIKRPTIHQVTGCWESERGVGGGEVDRLCALNGSCRCLLLLEHNWKTTPTPSSFTSFSRGTFWSKTKRQQWITATSQERNFCAQWPLFIFLIEKKSKLIVYCNELEWWWGLQLQVHWKHSPALP